MRKILNSKIKDFSFFEFIGVITFAVVISNYFLNKPLITFGVFIGYCLIGLFISILKFYLKYKQFLCEQKIENE